jgi:DNA-binding beta-propeller fold protein YncE
MMLRRALFLSFLALVAAALPAGAAEKIVLVAGGGTEADGPATKAKLTGPFGVDFDKNGTMYIVEMTGLRVLAVDDKGVLTHIAGTGKKGNGGNDGPAIRAEFDGPHSLAVGPNGIVYIADTWNNRVRAIDPKTGTIRAFAGTGKKGFAGDGGAAAEAEFGGVYCIAFDPKGEQMYLADLDNRRIRAIDMKTGKVRTVAGNGKKGVPKDGTAAIDAPLVDPRAVAADGAGNVYILERSGNSLRVVDAQGKIRTVAGTGKAGAGGDGSDALRATLNGPKHLCIDGDGNVIIADTENHLIRKYLPKDGKIVRVAGSGREGSAGLDGPLKKAELKQPHGVTIHKDGTLYISDSSNNRVLKIER